VKAISVRQPWAWLLLQAASPETPDKCLKPVENRTWPLPSTIFGRRVLIHASLTLDDYAGMITDIRRRMTDEQALRVMPAVAEMCEASYRGERATCGFFGCILGEVEIFGQTRDHPSLWFAGPYGFLVRKPVLYPPEKRVICRGQLGFFEVNLGGV